MSWIAGPPQSLLQFRKWTLSLLLLVAHSGCTLLDLPVFRQSAGSKGFNAQSEAIPVLACPDFEELPPARVAQYDGLKALIRSMDPTVDQERIRLAHERAISRTIQRVRVEIQKAQPQSVGRFNGLMRQHGRAIHQDPDQGLARLLQVTGQSESSNCSRAFLNYFLVEFVTELDPFASLEVSHGQEAELELRMGLPKGDWAEPSFTVHPDQIGVLALRRWVWDPKHEEIWESLTQAIQDNPGNPGKKINALVLDLRAAAGNDLDTFEEISEHLNELPVPVVIWVDRLTRGAPEAFAADWSSRGRAQVAGSTGMGYTRKFCSRVETLAEGTAPQLLVLGCEPWLSSNPALKVDYPLQLSSESLVEESRLLSLNAPFIFRPKADVGIPGIQAVSSDLKPAADPATLEKVLRLAKERVPR